MRAHWRTSLVTFGRFYIIYHWCDNCWKTQVRTTLMRQTICPRNIKRFFPFKMSLTTSVSGYFLDFVYLGVRTCETVLCFWSYCFPALYCFVVLCCLGRSLPYATGEIHSSFYRGWAQFFFLKNKNFGICISKLRKGSIRPLPVDSPQNC